MWKPFSLVVLTAILSLIVKYRDNEDAKVQEIFTIYVIFVWILMMIFNV